MQHSRDTSLRLTDGRVLSLAEYGPPGGTPMVLCHGLPGSRRQCPPDIGQLESLGVRLIVPERPGLGYSDPQSGRRLLDWPADLAQLADHLGLTRFALIGVSGGAPYALACAGTPTLARRIGALGIVSGMGPPHALGAMSWRTPAVLHLARRAPWLLRLPLAGFGQLARTDGGPAPQRLLGLLFKLAGAALPPGDRAILSRPEIAAQLRADLAEAFRQGAGGIVQELGLLAHPWGFRLQDIETPVRLWHGEIDGIVPIAVGRQVADALPRARATIVPAAGHFLIYTQWRTIVQQMLDDWRKT
ncbi:MAG: alpha/beta fold hydrolase [Gammaproteobacteria bacterium]